MEAVTLYPVWKEAVKVMLSSGLTYGSTIEKRKIVALCELPEPTTIPEKEQFDLQYLRVISEIKEELLLAHQMLMVSNYDGSYRIIAPKDQTTHAVESGARSIAREMRRMAQAVQHTNLLLLDDNERRKNADAQAKITMLAGMTRSGSSELRLIVD